MKQIRLTICVLFFFQVLMSCEEEVDPIPSYEIDDTSLTDSVRNGFLGQAQEIGISNYEFPSTSSLDAAFISESTIQPFYFALVSIYLAENIPARDSVMTMYPFTFAAPDQLHEIIVTVSSTHDWTDDWIRMEMETGITELDQLVELYDLRVTWWRSMAPYHDDYWFTLGTEKLISERGLAELFQSIPEIAIAEPNSMRFDGDWIRGSMSGEDVLIDFEKGWGDCPAGCALDHTWHFQVSPEGDVQYLGSSGDPIYPVGTNPY